MVPLSVTTWRWEDCALTENPEIATASGELSALARCVGVSAVPMARSTASDVAQTLCLSGSARPITCPEYLCTHFFVAIASRLGGK